MAQKDGYPLSKKEQPVEEKEETLPYLEGTNCGSCSWTKGTKTKDISPDELITMPLRGGDLPEQCHYCENPSVMLFVTMRQCCDEWETPGMIRPYDKLKD